MYLFSNRVARCHVAACVLFLGLCGCLRKVSEVQESKPPLQVLKCDVVIVGGGIAGVHTAYQLGMRGKKNTVCLFEKEARLGGRILDMSLPGDPDSSRIGIGARRFHEEQTLVRLSKELDIKFENAPSKDDLIIARSHRASSKDELAKLAYPALKDLDKGNGNNDVEMALLMQLRERRNIGAFADFPSYVRA